MADTPLPMTTTSAARARKLLLPLFLPLEGGSTKTERRVRRCQKNWTPSLPVAWFQPSGSLTSSSMACSFFSSSSLDCRVDRVRKTREERSTTSPADPARTGRARVGRLSPEERRTVRSLLCGPGSSERPGRSPGGGVFCVRSLLLHLPGPGGNLLSPWGAVLLHLHLFLRTSTVVESSCQGHADGLLLVPKHRAQPLLSSPPSSSCGLPAELCHCSPRKKKVTNLSEPGGGRGGGVVVVWWCVVVLLLLFLLLLCCMLRNKFLSTERTQPVHFLFVHPCKTWLKKNWHITSLVLTLACTRSPHTLNNTQQHTHNTLN